MSSKSTRHGVLYVACLILTLSLNACSTFPTSKPEAPSVKLLSVKPLKLGFLEQELGLQIQLSNPNTYDLALQSLTFVAKLDNEELAQGVSNDAVTIPAEGDAEMSVVVSTSISKVLGQLLSLASTPLEAIDYDIDGFVKLANWPVRIPFNVDGQLDDTSSN